MNEQMTVCVSTFGSQKYRDWAERAAYSARNMAPVIQVHGGESVAEARNLALAQVETEFVVFLDADDTLEPGYIGIMMNGSADVRAPSVRLIRDGRGGNRAPQLMYVVNCVHTSRHPGENCFGDCLQYGNYIVVGAAARTELLRSVGGFHDEPIFEDWALWLRCWKAGASFETLPEAVYRQHIRHDSRNHVGDAFDERHQWHDRIVRDVLGHNPLAA